MTSDNEDNIVLQPAVTDSSTQTMSPELKNEQQAAATVNFMHDADGDSFVAASSNAPERQPRVSSSSSGGQYTRRTGQARVAKPPRKAAALDFFGDGTTALHYCYQDSFSDVAPLFDCRIQPHSIRIVFYDTNALKTVLRTRAKDRDADSTVTDDTFAFTYCQKCTPAEYAPSTYSRQTSFQSAVSPRTRLPLYDRHASSIDDYHSNYDSGSFTYQRRSMASMSTVSQTSSDFNLQLVRDYAERRAYENICLDYQKLFQLWDDQARCPEIEVSTNIMFDTSFAEEDAEDKIWVRETDLPRHTLMMSDASLVFYTIPTLIENVWHYNDSLEVLAKFYTLQKGDYRKYSVLETRLWNVLSSGRCAMELFNGDTELGARLVTFDILTAMAICWIDFLDLVRAEGAPRKFRHLFTGKERPLSGDREHVTDFSRAVRDLLEAVKITIDAIQLVSRFDSTQQRAFDYILIEARARSRTLRSIMEDIEENMEQSLARAERQTNQGQATSVKRLSVIAAIFLPLTMASSLLSMNNRVRDLGPLWWDYAGIVTVVAFCVLTGYRLSTVWHDVLKDPRLQFGMRHANNEYRKAKDAVIEKKEEVSGPSKRLNNVLTFRSPATIYRATRDSFAGRGPYLIGMVFGAIIAVVWQVLGLRSKTLVPWPPKLAFRASKMLLVIGMMVSFVLGMFTSVRTGALALGYSVACAVGLLVATILLWRLQQLLWWTFPSIRASIAKYFKARKAQFEKKSNSADAAGTNESVDEPKQKIPWVKNKKSKRRMGAIIVFALPILFLLVVITYIASFLFGTFWIDILNQFEKNWTSAQESAEDTLSRRTSLVSRRTRSVSSYNSQRSRGMDADPPAPQEAQLSTAHSDVGRQPDEDHDIEMQRTRPNQ